MITDIALIKQEFSLYRIEHGEDNPENTKRKLPTIFIWKALYIILIERIMMKNDGWQPPTLSYFASIRKQYFPQFAKARLTGHGSCETCTFLKNRAAKLDELIRKGDLDETNREDLMKESSAFTQASVAHRDLIANEREHYNHRVTWGEGEDGKRRRILSIVADATPGKKVPDPVKHNSNSDPAFHFEWIGMIIYTIVRNAQF